MSFFFVHIIESPSPDDLLKSRWEGILLQEALRIAGVSCSYNLCINKTTFTESLQGRLIEGIRKNKSKLPILHFSAHGNKDGFDLSSEESVKWRDLEKMLIPINKALNDFLIVGISSCEGFCGYSIAMSFSNELPFFLLCGPMGKPTWAESAIAFMTFYYQLSRRASPSEALEAMKIASGHHTFNFELAKNVQNKFIEQLKNLTQADIDKTLNALEDLWGK